MDVSSSPVATTRSGNKVEQVTAHHYRSSDGLDLVADVAGPAAAPGVVLLHGGGQTRHSWSGAMLALVARGYRVVSFDARGHGDSGWSDDGAYSLDDRVADLRVIVADFKGRYALVGASLGGATAIHAVAGGLTPTALVLVDIVPQPEASGVDRIVAFMRANPDGFADLEEASSAVAAYNPLRPPPRDTSGLMRNLRLRENGRLYWHWDPRITQTRSTDHQRVVQRSAAALARAGELSVMLVRGLSSDVVSDAGVEAFRSQLPSLEVANVSGAGHMVAGDRNDAFNTSMIEFLVRHLPVTTSV
ncbi:alpha/beta fold hydrolase [Sphingomonas sp.]|uniref:alpha/beta fold hydrolase n=1 Tax=Sphingomonas sp. TaxID=28214 RepID=UPI003CC5862D